MAEEEELQRSWRPHLHPRAILLLCHPPLDIPGCATAAGTANSDSRMERMKNCAETMINCGDDFTAATVAAQTV